MSQGDGKDAQLRDCEKCQSIFWNLIRVIESGSSQHSVQNSTLYIREFFQTARCDPYSDLSKDREAYEKHLGKEALVNILNYKETEEDERKGAQAVLHYGYWNHKRLISSLNCGNWLYYHTFHQPTRLAEFVAIGGAAYGGIRLASRTMASIRTRYPASRNGKAKPTDETDKLNTAKNGTP
jgi:hypothetical protein